MKVSVKGIIGLLKGSLIFVIKSPNWSLVIIKKMNLKFILVTITLIGLALAQGGGGSSSGGYSGGYSGDSGYHTQNFS